MLRLVPAALERYCALRGLSRADALVELERVDDLLGPERPAVVTCAASPLATRTERELVAGV